MMGGKQGSAPIGGSQQMAPMGGSQQMAPMGGKPQMQQLGGQDLSPYFDAAQEQIAKTTMALENEFSRQFSEGNINPEALSPSIDQVLQSMPEQARPKVQQHIQQVIEQSKDLASQMSPDERKQVATPPSSEQVGKTTQGLVSSWGWPSCGGFGGVGAFGFPSMYYGTNWYANPYGYGNWYSRDRREYSDYGLSRGGWYW